MYPSTCIHCKHIHYGPLSKARNNAATLGKKEEEDEIPSKQAPVPMAYEQIVLHYAIVHEQSQENKYIIYKYVYTLVLIIYINFLLELEVVLYL